MERVIELHVQQRGVRVDTFVAREAPGLSRTFVQKLLADGRVTVNDSVPKASYRLEVGDIVVIRVPPAQPIELCAEDIPLTIVYEDGDILVVDKPAGLVVHPAHGHRRGTLVNALLARCRDLSGIGGELRPGIVHRLDKDTSGLLLVAKHDAAHRYLQRQFQQRLIRKAYLALAEGLITAAHGMIDAPIGRDPLRRKRMALLSSGGREARTEFRVLERFSQHTLLEAEPITGRTHQIRIHLASIGHPVAGDRVYGFRRQRLPLSRQFLHASRLTFSLPSSEREVEFTSDLPEDLATVLSQLRAK